MIPIRKLTEQEKKYIKNEYHSQKKPGYEESLCKHGGCVCVGVHKHSSKLPTKDQLLS